MFLTGSLDFSSFDCRNRLWMCGNFSLVNDQLLVTAMSMIYCALASPQYLKGKIVRVKSKVWNAFSLRYCFILFVTWEIFRDPWCKLSMKSYISSHWGGLRFVFTRVIYGTCCNCWRTLILYQSISWPACLSSYQTLKHLFPTCSLQPRGRALPLCLMSHGMMWERYMK